MVNIEPKYIPKSPKELYELFSGPFPIAVSWDELSHSAVTRYIKLFNTLYRTKKEFPAVGSLVKIELVEYPGYWWLGIVKEETERGDRCIRYLDNSGSGLVRNLDRIKGMVLLNNAYKDTTTLWNE